MKNYKNMLDELFSSSQEEDVLNENIPSTVIDTQVKQNLVNDNCNEIVEQMINQAEVDQEVKIILNEKYIQCIGRELIDSDSDIEEPSVTGETRELKVTLEYDVKQEDCFSEQDQSLEVLVPTKTGIDEDFDWFMDGIDFKSDYFQKIESERLKAIQEKEEKEKRYFVEKVEPRTDFSEYGEWADLYEEEHKQKLLQYKLDVARVKKLKADDKQKEKIQKEIARNKLAKERSDKKVERTFKKLQVKLERQGHYAKVIGYNDSQSLIKLSIPVTYHRLVDNCGRIIMTSPFIEVSSTKAAFYCYNNKQGKFILYANLGEVTGGEYKRIHDTITQKEMWDYILVGDKVGRMGFIFHKYESFDSARLY